MTSTRRKPAGAENRPSQAGPPPGASRTPRGVGGTPLYPLR